MVLYTGIHHEKAVEIAVDPACCRTDLSHAERPSRQVSELVMRQVGRAAAAPSAQAAGGLQRSRGSRAVVDEQSRRSPRKARQGSSEALSQDSATPCWSDEGWRARCLPLGERGGLSGRGGANALALAPAAAGAKVTGAARRARLLRYTDIAPPHPLDQCLHGHL